jgi:GT2 family glycosyltransferase
MVRRSAERHGARVIRLDRQQGPGAARNRGAKEASGDILFFVDADVVLHDDALALAVGTFESEPNVCAVFGSYDDEPAHRSFLSQYRNLFHHWVHQASDTEASTFWAGCGAIRRMVFMESGGFDCDYRYPSIEDIELGGRLRRAGHRIRLNKSMFGRHLKQWRFWNMVFTDIFVRGAPWMRLLLRDRQVPSQLNLSYRSRMATMIAVLLLASVLVLPAAGRWAAIAPMAVFLLAAVTCGALAGAHAARGMTAGAVAGLAIVAPVLTWVAAPDPLAIIPLSLCLALVLTHLPFYRLILARRGIIFAMAVVPLQVVFFLGCAVSVPLGIVGFLMSRGISD